jgi:hypothetical protein
MTEELEFDSRQRQEIFPYFTASKPALGPIQPPIQWVLGVVSSGIKRPAHEADCSPPSSAEVKNVGAAPPIRHTFSCHGARDNFTFTSASSEMPCVFHKED